MRDFYVHAADIPTLFPSAVLPYLTDHRRDGYLPGYDGKPLHYAVFTPENARKTVVISHGFTESIEKYHEAVYYFLRSGCRVWILEHRGHGHSPRAVQDPSLTHIRRFEEYTDDFALFMEEVLKDAPGKPCLYAHSMGCAIALLYMERHPDTFERAFLSSPMIVPESGGVPIPLARAVLRGALLFGRGKKRAFISAPYTGKEAFESSCKTCRERFDEYEAIKEATPEFHTTCSTYGWAYQSLRVRKMLMKKGAPEKVDTPILMALAGQDTTVSRPPQLALAARLPHCTVKTYEDAKHEIFGSGDETVFPYFDDLLQFFGV